MATTGTVRRLVPAPGYLSRRVARSLLAYGMHNPVSLINQSELVLLPQIKIPATPIYQRSIFSMAAAALGQTSSKGNPQTLTTIRTLPYAANELFGIISDVESYADFLPHCTVSRVTAWRKGSISDKPGGPIYPSEADLTVGWGPLSQTYSSRVYCVPKYGVVEAVSGRSGVPTLSAEERVEIGLGKESMSSPAPPASTRRAGRPATPEEDDTFESLVTRWKVMSLAASNDSSHAPTAEWTRVELQIRFQFRNPLYQMAAAQVGNEMATKMIEAFEKRTVDLLGPRPPHSTVNASRRGRL